MSRLSASVIDQNWWVAMHISNIFWFSPYSYWFDNMNVLLFSTFPGNFELKIASLCGSVGKDFVYHACGHEFESRMEWKISNFLHPLLLLLSDSCRGMAMWFGAHYYQEVRFRIAVSTNRGLVERKLSTTRTPAVKASSIHSIEALPKNAGHPSFCAESYSVKITTVEEIIYRHTRNSYACNQLWPHHSI